MQYYSPTGYCLSFALLIQSSTVDWAQPNRERAISRSKWSTARWSFKTNVRPVLMPKVKAGLFPHHVRYTPCSASPLLHHIFNSCLLPTSSSSNSLGQSSTPSPSGSSPTFHLPSHTHLCKLLQQFDLFPILQTHLVITFYWISCPYFKVQPEPQPLSSPSSSYSHSW